MYLQRHPIYFLFLSPLLRSSRNEREEAADEKKIIWFCIEDVVSL
jgi:hypothetical protein